MVSSTKWRMVLLCAFCLSLNVKKAAASQDLLAKMSVTFFKTVYQCQKELDVSEDDMKKLLNFWHENQELTRDLGCVILCLASKHDLIEMSEYKVHQERAFHFAINHGADDEAAKQIVQVMDDCDSKFPDKDDQCQRVAHVAVCFRDHMHSIKWAPPAHILLQEIMTEF
ncbi:hypothetical protein ACJJTC_019456 [Scirpophaga incertulas]